MYTYVHRVNYYETDRMGITHHSNYIRWMEEARVAYLNQLGCGYAKQEEDGIISPVISVECQYKRTTTFDDEVNIEIEVAEYSGVRLAFCYTMTNAATGDLVLTGRTEHCFLNRENKPVIVKKFFPELDSALRKLAER